MRRNLIMLAVTAVMGLSMNLEAEKAASNSYTELDSYFEHLKDNNKVAGSAAIYKDGKKDFAKVLLVEDGKLVDGVDQYRYKIGSISKTFTATLVYQLIEAGKISLDTKLSKYFPTVKNAEKITIEQMMGHSSGLYNYTDHESFLSYYQDPQTRDSMVKRIETYEPAFEPGQKNSYSNSNYLLLGYIIEDITGKDYGEVVAEQIAKPLGLKETYLEVDTETEKNEVFSFVKKDGWELVPQWEMSSADAAGALVSTSKDLNKFFKALFDGDLISKKSLESMIATSEDNDFGDGIFKRVNKFDGKELTSYWHSGGIENFRSMMIYFPEEKMGITFLANGGNYSLGDITKTITKSALGMDIEIPNFDGIEVSVEILKGYEGDYQSDTFPLGIKIFVEDEKLMAQADGQGAFELTAMTESEFEFSDAGINITFDGKNDQFVIKQHGGANVFVKKSKKKESKSASVNEKILKQYLGLYKSDNFPLDIEIKLKDGALQAQATGQPAFPLTTESETKFKFDLAKIVIEFDASKNQLTITQHGKATVMTK